MARLSKAIANSQEIVYRKAKVKPGYAIREDIVKKPHGHPRAVVDDFKRGQVKTLAIAGTRHDLIAKVMKISEVTLRKYYREELDASEIMANAAVARNLYSKATGNGPTAVTAAIFWLKTRAGWKEAAQDHNVQGDLRVLIAKGDFGL